MTEGADAQTIIMPGRDFMDAAETISWIAYGKALSKYSWTKAILEFSREWDFKDVIGIETEDPPGPFLFERWCSTAHELHRTLRVRALGAPWPTHPLIRTEEGHEAAEKYLQRLGAADPHSWLSFADQLRIDIEKRDVCLARLRFAAGKLRRELYKGTLVAWGSRDTNDPFNGPPRQKIGCDEWPPGVEIDFDGHVRENGGWDRGIRWMLLSFDTEEVLTIWPPSLFRTQVPMETRDGGDDQSSRDPIMQWLVTFVQTERTRLGAPPKRDQAIRACQDGVGCTYREARAAWDGLPATMKRQPRSRTQLPTIRGAE